jgi:PncC family amidohydrolase
VELGQTVGVAESLTGGLISSLLTESPGTSVTFRGGLVVYAPDLKHSIAGVRRHDLERHASVTSSRTEAGQKLQLQVQRARAKITGSGSGNGIG